MRSSLRFSVSLACVLALGGAMAGCGDDDDTDENAQTGSDASVNESGSGGRASSAGRSGSGGSRATAGRSGGAGESAGAGAAGARAGAGGASGATSAAGRSGGVAGAGAGTGGAPASGGNAADAGTSLSDGQVAAITTAANAGEIQLGTLAQNRARLPEVRAFAREMIDNHGAAQSRSTALLQTLNITPVQNDLSAQLEQGTQRVATTLQNTSAANFDLAYVQSQIDIHIQVLKLFDETLLPNVTAVALRTDLTLARGDVQRHLSEAQALLVVVQSAPPDLDAGTEDAGL